MFAEGAVQELAGKRVEIKRAVPREELPPPQPRNSASASPSAAAAAAAARGSSAARRAAAAASEPDAFAALMAHHAAAVGAMHAHPRPPARLAWAIDDDDQRMMRDGQTSSCRRVGVRRIQPMLILVVFCQCSLLDSDGCRRALEPVPR